MIRKIGLPVTLLFALFYLSFGTAGYANPPTREEQYQGTNTQEKQTWNFNDSDIRTVINQVSKQVGKNFIIDPRVKGKVSLISSHPLSPDELYQMFLSMLQVNGYTTVSQGPIIKIIPESEVRGAPTPVLGNMNDSASDQVIVQVLKVRNVPVRSLVNALRSFMPKASTVEAYEPTNDLIITASKAGVTRIRDIVEKLDRPSSGNTSVVKLRYAAPIDMVQMLQAAVGQDPNGGRSQVALAADERTGSVVIGADMAQRLRLQGIISQLDVPSNNYGDTQVIYMKYIEAKDIAPILANIIGQYVDEHKLGGSAPPPQFQAQPSNNNGDNSANQPGPPPGLSASLSPNGGNGYGSSGSANGGSTGAGGGGIMNSTPDSSFFADQNGAKSGTVGPYVQWEQTTNSVIVKAPPAIMRTVKSVIAQLDIRRAQVLVDVIIAEVNVDRARELGVEWNSGGDVPVRTSFPPISPVTQIVGGLGATGFATTQIIPEGTDTSALQAASNVVQSLSPGNGITVGFINHGNLRAILRALASDTSSNVVATPNLVTLDNEVANIKVGQMVAFAVGTTNNYNTGGLPFTSYDRQEVGLNLTIRPQITQTGAVKLKIENALSSLIPGVVDGGGNPRTTDRVISTNIMVDNGQILVLGGLLQNDWNHSVSKVPILGDIPILGFLFRSNSKQMEKKNLMIFLRPVILRDNNISVLVSGDKYSQMRQELLDSRNIVDQPYSDEPVAIPPLGGEKALPPPYPAISEK